MSTNKLGNIIILEGVDAAGKTTLAELFRKMNPGISIKINDVPKDASVEEHRKIKSYYHSCLSILNAHSDMNISFDRFFPSELVYSKVKRNTDNYKKPFVSAIEEKIATRNHLLVYCDPGIDTIKERLLARGDHYISINDVEALYNEYNNFLEKTTLKVLRVDTKKSPEEIAEIIKRTLNK